MKMIREELIMLHSIDSEILFLKQEDVIKTVLPA